MLSDSEKRQIMRWIWDQMHHSDLKLPSDQLIFEGEHDLAYLYDCGFVDTDRYSYEKWIRAFSAHRQKDGSYRLTLDEWLTKTPYRYFGPIEPPFDVMNIREGEWTVQEYKNFAKEKILPELTLTYEQFLVGLEQAKKSGDIVDDKIIMTQERKQKLAETMERFASPKRRRALDAFQYQKEEDLEVPRATGQSLTSGNLPTASATKKVEQSTYRAEPDKQKQVSGKLSDLLSGSKK